MDNGNKFRCTGKWNGEEFDRVIEAGNEGNARDHWMFWAWIGKAQLESLEITKAD